MSKQWTTERRPLSDLKLWDDNPRTLDESGFKDIQTSLDEDGDWGVIAIDTDGTIISGNQRYRALLSKGITEADVKVAPQKLTEKERRRIALRANRTKGKDNWDMLANWDKDDLKAGWFSDEDIDRMFSLEEDEFDAEGEYEAIQEPVAQLGDLYSLGNHRLLCGDVTKLEDVAKLMGGAKANLLFTDPPYNVAYTGGAGGDWKGKPRQGILNDKMSPEEFYDFLFSFCSNVLSHLEGATYICMSSSELHTLHKAFTDAGGHWQTYIIWAKNSFTLSRSDYQHQFEPIMYGFNKSLEDIVKDSNETDDTNLPILYGWHKRHAWYGGRKQGDVWFIDRPTKSKEHPTMKPLALCGKAIVNSSKHGDIVLDTFSGSGSTLLACEQLNRNCYAMELDPKYVDVAIKRWETYTGRKAIKLN